MKKLIYIIFGGAVLLTIVLFVVFNFVCYKVRYEDSVEKYSKAYNLDKSLVMAIIKAESDFDNNAVSKSGAMGLMQLIPSTSKWIAGELKEDYATISMFDPETNIKFGCFYLRYLFDKFYDQSTVICAYNAGEGVVKSWFGYGNVVEETKITYDETREYLKRVNSYKKVYDLQFGLNWFSFLDKKLLLNI